MALHDPQPQDPFRSHGMYEPLWYELHHRQVRKVGDSYDLIKVPAWRRRRAMRNKRIRVTRVSGYFVSTTFLALDHRLSLFEGEENPPVVFETMAFNYKDTEVDYSGVYQDRTCTHRQALRMHWAAVKMAKQGVFDNR